MSIWNKAVSKVLNMRTILWEPMTGRIYAEYNSLSEALNGRYSIGPDDYFESRNGELWIALND